MPKQSSKAALRVMERAGRAFLDERGFQAFRRSDLASKLLPLTRPRDRQAAEQFADMFIRVAAACGVVVRKGRLHWRAVSTTRTLKSGRLAPALVQVVKLPVHTHCPAKWALVDLETGQVWHGAESGWRAASAEVRAEAKSVLL